MTVSGTVGGTGAAAIVCQEHAIRYFGRTAWDVYLRWLGEDPDWQPAPPMVSGLRLEASILDWYATERPGWRLDRQVQLVSPCGRYHGSLDGLLTREADGAVEVVDAKRAVMRIEEWGTDAAPVVPAGYQVQLAHYALLAEEAGRTVHAAALAIYDPFADAHGYDAWRIRYLPWADLRPLALEWRALCDAQVARWEAGDRPAWDGSDAAQEWLRVHCAPPRGKGRDERHAEDDEAEIIARWLDAKRRKSAADQEARALAQDIIDRAGGHKLWLGEGYVQAQAAGGGTRLDSKSLKTDHPELWAQYARESTPGVALRDYRFPK